MIHSINKYWTRLKSDSTAYIEHHNLPFFFWFVISQFSIFTIHHTQSTIHDSDVYIFNFFLCKYLCFKSLSRHSYGSKSRMNVIRMKVHEYPLARTDRSRNGNKNSDFFFHIFLLPRIVFLDTLTTFHKCLQRLNFVPLTFFRSFLWTELLLYFIFIKT